MDKFHLWPLDMSLIEGSIRTGFVLEDVGGERKTLWYQVPEQFSSALTQWCDPFVLAALFSAMSTPADLVIHGQVSPSLLFNLEEFQSVWNSWLPDYYTAIEIIPDTEQERPKAGLKDAVVAFSGGADSCYTAWHYTKPKNERLLYSLPAGVFIHGYDFPLKHMDTFDRAIKKLKFSWIAWE